MESEDVWETFEHKTLRGKTTIISNGTAQRYRALSTIERRNFDKDYDFTLTWFKTLEWHYIHMITLCKITTFRIPESFLLLLVWYSSHLVGIMFVVTPLTKVFVLLIQHIWFNKST